MKNKIAGYQRQVLKALAGKADNFYLAGGTALSLFYFQHRLSVDLDFFTGDFVYREIEVIVSGLEKALDREVLPVGRVLDQKMVKMAVYNIRFTKNDILKVDFVEDFVGLLKATKVVDGIRVLSLEDIYLRKLYALTGMTKIADQTGRDEFIGGRSDAKDYYDLYFLSHTFKPLSKFAARYCDRTMIEAIIRWFRTYDRMRMMDGVLNLITNAAIDYRAMERHFKTQVDKVLESELGGI